MPVNGEESARKGSLSSVVSENRFGEEEYYLQLVHCRIPTARGSGADSYNAKLHDAEMRKVQV
ncbi:hypothetical protein BDV40DRAFT_253124 [Aspergillus tamarii]|uniref:Uncharacterized protein n=1 Tax=Aspergillus tamarii TaxID=41984 RepID=A0A5N6V9I5_ASPTM|nr:hypothetical protein BDV40DRAFT_253124 [Aspergillus tamarii]